MRTQKARHTIKENFSFFKSWARSPRTTGSIIPSTSSIGHTMGGYINLERDGYIVEIGAGTGALTQGLLKSGIHYKRIILVELNKNLVKHLNRKFPDVLVIHGDAQKLEELLPEHIKKDVQAIVSGLPFVSLPKKISYNILQAIEKLLPEKGIFLQFTYRPWKSPLKSANFIGERIGREFFNFPPAAIWSYRKKENS